MGKKSGFGIDRGNREKRRIKRQIGPANQLQGVTQPNAQRGAYRRPDRSGKTSTTQHPEQEQGAGGMLQGVLAGKQAVDGISGLYKAGGDVREGVGKGMDWMGQTWDNSPLGDTTSGLSMPSFDMSMPEFFSGSASQGSSVPLPTDFGMADGTINSLGGEFVGANSSFASPASLGADPASGLLADSTGAMADGATTTGLQGSGATLSQALPYLNIGKDLIMGSDKLTGNQWGDTALRGGLAYATGGLSELGYMAGDMFDWW